MQRIKWIWFWKRKWIIGTLLEEDDKYIIYDQIDKSSESFIVYSYLKINYYEQNMPSLYYKFITNYLSQKIS